jgi:hypothetical protein
MEMMRAYPAAFSAYMRQARKGRQKGGELFLWTQSLPKLLFLTVRDSSVGATRLRHVQKTLITLARDYALYDMPSLAIAPLGNRYERNEIMALYEMWLRNVRFSIIIYTDYQAGLQADERL